MGRVVVADVIVNTNVEVSQIKKDLTKKLNKYEIPLKINIVDNINTNSNGKLVRK
jgi:acyl-coenzyme A synthetase/AMP-(fatty) acid ligase